MKQSTSSCLSKAPARVSYAGREKTSSIVECRDMQVPQSFSGENVMLILQLHGLWSCCTGLFVVHVHAPVMFLTPACTLFSMEIQEAAGRQCM